MVMVVLILTFSWGLLQRQRETTSNLEFPADVLQHSDQTQITCPPLNPVTVISRRECTFPQSEQNLAVGPQHGINFPPGGGRHGTGSMPKNQGSLEKEGWGCVEMADRRITCSTLEYLDIP